jgi:hypothetical protein
MLFSFGDCDLLNTGGWRPIPSAHLPDQFALIIE